MKFHPSTVPMSALALALCASFASIDAQAVSQTRRAFANPTGICQGALPNFEGVLKKRPLAFQNNDVGNGPSAFITCSFTAQGGSGVTKVATDFASADGVGHDVTCTGVSGYAGAPFIVEYIVKQVFLPFQGIETITWSAADFAGSPSVFPSVTFSISCSLEPGVSMHRSQIEFLEDVGA